MKIFPLVFVSCLFVTGSMGLSAAATTSGSSSCEVVPVIPPVPAGTIVLTAGADLDATVSIQKAFDAMKPGDALVFGSGTFNISKRIVVTVPHVTLYGSGATIHSTNGTDGALVIQSDDVSVYGFTFTQEVTSRQTTPWAGGIAIYDVVGSKRRRIDGATIQGNVFLNTAGGIFVYKVSGFTIADNRVFRSLADGIHITAGSRDGRVIHNSVSENGDDMIAIVSYAGNRVATTIDMRYQNWAQQQDELDQNIYVGNNQVSDQYWGRGISVVGGSNVTIEANNISKTATGAGVYLTRETSYLTFGDHNILVDGNVITHIQTDSPTYKPTGFVENQTRQGAIEIAAQMTDAEFSDLRYRQAFSVTNVAIVDNQIQNARFTGIRIGMFSPAGAVSQVNINGNALQTVANNNIVDVEPGLIPTTLACSGNTLNELAWDTKCVTSIASVVSAYPITGSTLQCDSAGNISNTGLRIPKPPSGVVVN